MSDDDIFMILLIVMISMILVVEAFYIFGRPKVVPRPAVGCQSCLPGENQGNPSGCKLPDNYQKCKSWTQQHPGGCCVYDANKGFTCYQSGPQCQGASCDNNYDNGGFSCNGRPPVAANIGNGCRMCSHS